MRISFAIIGLLLLLGFTPSALALQNPSAEEQVSELYNLASQLRADYGSLSRFYTIRNSPERRIRMEEFFNSYQDKLDKLKFNQLSNAGQVDYILIQRYIDDNLYQLKEEGEEVEKMREWTSFADPIYAIEKQRRRGRFLNSEEVAKQLNDISEQLDKLSSQLTASNTLYPKILTDRASRTIRGHQQALSSVFTFYDGYDSDFSWWVTKPYEKLTKQLGDYAKVIRSKVDPTTQPEDDGSGIIGNPIGRVELIRQLKKEMIPYTPEELVDMAMAEFAWCDEELLKASIEMGFGDDWKAAQEKVKMSFVPAGQQPEAMLDLYNQSVDFLKSNDLISIPPIAEETWRMTMISPERQLISPFFLGGEVLQIAYPTDDMEHDDKMMSMRGNNPHFSRSTVHHELIAGHHLQRFMNNRYKDYRFFDTPFWTEGWALYWELLLWDKEFPRNAEDRIGMLFWRMHRCARIIFSLNYHLNKWTPQECIDFLVDRVGHERANAEAEVRRSFTGNYGPLYQIAYMVGGQQFYSLKRELVDNGDMSLKEFHDAVMRENAMPVEMVRAILTKQKLSRDFKTNWRFYSPQMNAQGMKKY